MPVSFGGILSNARTALTAAQTAIGVTSDNIANASTPGYSRKRAEIASGYPLTMPEGQVGTGVFVRDIARLRDTLLDRSFRDASSGGAAASTRSSVLGQLEGLFGEPSDTGFGAALDAFYGGWSDLASHPTSDAARTVVRERGDQLAMQFRRLASGIQQLTADTELRVNVELDRVNELTRQIAQLNVAVVAAESGGNSAGSLRDQRDLLVDEVASLAPVTVLDRGNGAVAVVLGGVTLVDGDNATALRLDTTGGAFTVRTSRGVAVDLAGSGSIGGGLSLLSSDLPRARETLDVLAREIARGVNTAHAAGMNPDGDTGVLFFHAPVDALDPTLIDYSQVNASNLGLSAAVQSSTRAIAAGSATDVAGVPTYAPGNTDVASAIAALRDDASSAGLGSRSAGEFYDGLVTRLGLAKRSADDEVQVQSTLTMQAESRRDSVSGVSTDEELVNLIRFQNAYSAATRVISTVDEMMQTLLDMKR